MQGSSKASIFQQQLEKFAEFQESLNNFTFVSSFMHKFCVSIHFQCQLIILNFVVINYTEKQPKLKSLEYWDATSWTQPIDFQVCVNAGHMENVSARQVLRHVTIFHWLIARHATTSFQSYISSYSF
jgi:hypothetical protein